MAVDSYSKLEKYRKEKEDLFRYLIIESYKILKSGWWNIFRHRRRLIAMYECITYDFFYIKDHPAGDSVSGLYSHIKIFKEFVKEREDVIAKEEKDKLLWQPIEKESKK